MRNHSGSDTRRQEFYQFEGPEDFRSVIEARYRLIPYLYSEYMKAALRNDMMFKPLAFVYPGDEIAAQTEDQLMLGDQVMIAPVYTQNAIGRMVYLPEEMLFVKFGPQGSITQEVLPARRAPLCEGGPQRGAPLHPQGRLHPGGGRRPDGGGDRPRHHPDDRLARGQL